MRIVHSLAVAAVLFACCLGNGAPTYADQKRKIEIVPPKPERVLRVAATFCQTVDQIQLVATMTLAGNSPEEALMYANPAKHIELCERGMWQIRRPRLVSLYATTTHVVAIFKVATLVGSRYMFLAAQRISV